MLVGFFFSAAACASQGIVAQTFAQSTDSSTVVAAQSIRYPLPTAPLASPSFSHNVSSSQPHLVLTMVEARVARPVEGRAPYDSAIDTTFSMSTPFESPIVSAQESVSRHGQDDNIRPRNIIDSTATTVQYGSTGFGASEPRQVEAAWFEHSYTAFWCTDVNQGHTIRGIDRGLFGQSPTNVEPLMMDELGSGSLPISLHVPALR